MVAWQDVVRKGRGEFVHLIVELLVDLLVKLRTSGDRAIDVAENDLLEPIVGVSNVADVHDMVVLLLVHGKALNGGDFTSGKRVGGSRRDVIRKTKGAHGTEISYNRDGVRGGIAGLESGGEGAHIFDGSPRMGR